MLEVQEPIGTTNGMPFTTDESKLLAMLVFKRFGNDPQSATAAWRRLLQNNSGEGDFKQMIGDIENQSAYLAKVTLLNDGYEETQMCLVDAVNERQAAIEAIKRCARDKLEWENDFVANDCNGEIKLKLHSVMPINSYEKIVLDKYL